MHNAISYVKSKKFKKIRIYRVEKMSGFKAVTVGITLTSEEPTSGPSSFLELQLFWITVNTEGFVILAL
jgi:hypothetical protein